MNYVGQFCSRVFGVYKTFNSATLSGAIDVIVIEQEDGSLSSTPFHVRFGKSGILRPKENVVDLCVNDVYIPDLHMKLGEAGEAFFLVQGQPERGNENQNSATTDSHVQLEISNSNGQVELDAEFSDTSSIGEHDSDFSHMNIDPVTYYSDCEMPRSTSAYRLSRANSQTHEDAISGYRSDSEIVESIHVAGDAANQIAAQMNWEWGKLPHSTTLDSVMSGEYYDCMDDGTSLPSATFADAVIAANNSTVNLKEENKGSVMAEKVSADNKQQVAVETASHLQRSDVQDIHTGSRSRFSSSGECYLSELDDNNAHLYLTGSPVARSGFCPSPESGYKSDSDNLEDELSSGVQISLCGGLGHTISPERFISHLISYEEFIRNPDELIKNEDLVIRIQGKNYNWQTAAPILLSKAAFGTNLPARSIGNLKDKYMKRRESLKKKRPAVRSWFNWGRTAPAGENEEAERAEQTLTNAIENDSLVEPQRSILAAQIKGKIDEDKYENSKPDVTQGQQQQTKYTKSIRPSSDSLKKLGFKPGYNELTFSVTTKYQGTTRCVCSVFLWKWNDRIVISDIDGTITKSDVLGQILPVIGRDWTQQGVAQLFTTIKKNNYKMVYLSSRAIGQSGLTRRLLQKIHQEGIPLPEGPLLLSPASLIRAFHQEVILKKPEEFKISCLNDLRSLFPSHINPFWAGFGNKSTDAKSYMSVGIEKSKCFIVNHLGQVKNETSLTFQSSYKELAELSDHVFPHIQPDKSREASNFNEFAFWRDPLPHVDVLSQAANICNDLNSA